MNIKIKNLGPIKTAKVQLNDFNILMGKNNTGKTYFSYCLFGFYKSWFRNTDRLNVEKDLEKLMSFESNYIELKKYIKPAKKKFLELLPTFSQNISSIFSANEDEFPDFSFQIESEKYYPSFSNSSEYSIKISDRIELKFSRKANSDKLEISSTNLTKWQKLPKGVYRRLLSELIFREVFSELLPNPKVITSERSGIHLFQNELDINKNVLLDKLMSSKKGNFEFDPFDYIKETIDRYSMPIMNGIDQARDSENISKNSSFIYKQHKDFLKRVGVHAGVGYKQIKDKIYVTYKEGRKKQLLPLYLGSSSSRALLDLHIYFKHQANKGDILIIDEPELNLHPEMQISLIRLLVEASNLGIKIFLTSHSDYIMKELNNLIMLSHEFPKKKEFMKKYKYQDSQSIKPKNVSVLIAEKNTISQVEVDKFGITKTSFDDPIEKINEVSNKLFELNQ